MRIGPYDLVENTGTRGVISAYAGERVRDNLPVTFNALSRQHLSDDLLRRRMRREFEAARSIESPHVVKYIDLVETEDAVVVVTERLPAMNLRAYLTLASEVSCDEAMDIAKQVAQGLHACHLSGVVHRSVSPENIYITDHKDVRIANFGLASVHTATTLTMTGTMIGDPEYAPPENLFSAPRDVRGDIYSLGIVLWEMLTGQNPFEGDSLTEIIHKKQDGSLPVLSGAKPDVPHWIDILVSDMTAADPDKRPASLHEVLVALDNESHIVRTSQDDSDNCLACGYPLPVLEELWFCPYCGRTALENSDDSKPSVVLIKSVHDKESTTAFLERTFRTAPKKDIGRALTQTPVPVTENIKADESLWLTESLKKTGCSIEVLPLSAWYYKVSALIMFCVLQIVLIMVYVKPWNETYGIPASASTVFWVLKAVLIVSIASIMIYYIGIHYAPPFHIPLRFIQGAFCFEPFSTFVSSTQGVLSSVVVVAVTVAVYCLGSILLLPLIYNIIGLLVVHNSAMDRQYYTQGLVYMVLSIGPLLILKIIVGRLYKSPLYELKTTRHGASDVHQRSDFALLDRLRAQVSEIHSRDFRYIISSVIEQYTYVSRLLASNGVPDSLCHELSGTLFFAMKAVSAIGDQVIRGARDASTSEVERADKNYLRLGIQVNQPTGNVSEALKEEWRAAQDRVLHHEVAVEMLAKQLNTLRLISGSMRAAVVQAVPGVQQVDGSWNRQGLEMLGDVLNTVSAENRKRID